MSKYNWEGIKCPSKKDDLKSSREWIQILFLMLYALKKKKYARLIFQNLP